MTSEWPLNSEAEGARSSCLLHGNRLNSEILPKSRVKNKSIGALCWSFNVVEESYSIIWFVLFYFRAVALISFGGFGFVWLPGQSSWRCKYFFLCEMKYILYPDLNLWYQWQFWLYLYFCASGNIFGSKIWEILYWIWIYWLFLKRGKVFEGCCAFCVSWNVFSPSPQIWIENTNIFTDGCIALSTAL